MATKNNPSKGQAAAGARYAAQAQQSKPAAQQSKPSGQQAKPAAQAAKPAAQAAKPAALKQSQIFSFTPSKTAAAAAARPMADQGAAYVEGARLGQPYDPNFGKTGSTGPTGPAGPGDGIDTTVVDTGPTDYERFLMAQAAEKKRLSEMNATETMKGLLQSFGLNALYNKVVDFVKQGYDADSIMVLIRTTPEYKQRFPAMDALAQKGRAMSESEYIAYEKTASGLERRYGLPDGMLMNNVTKLLTNEVSPVELNDRVLLASAAAIQAPREVKDMFKQYYGIDQGGMTAYFLDPDVATPLLEKQFATSVIGSEAARQGIGIDVYGAENLQGLGITQEQARQGFGQVAAATGLTAGRGDIVTQQELMGSAFNTSADAQKAVERAIGGRLGRFQGGGEFLQQGGQNVGLGTAATR